MGFFLPFLKLVFLNGFSFPALLGGQYVFGWFGLLLLVMFFSRYKVTLKKCILFIGCWDNNEFNQYFFMGFL